MFRLFLGNVQVQLFGVIPNEAFILASSLFPPRLPDPVHLLVSEFSSNKGAQRATGTSARASELQGPGGGGERLEGLGSWYRPLESSGKCDRKEELRRSMKRCPQSQLCPDANVPAVGAKGQDTERVHQAGSMARPHRNLRPCWPVPRCYLSSR